MPTIRTCLFFCLACCVLLLADVRAAKAQDALEELKTIMAAYKRPALSFNGNITLATAATPGKLIDAIPLRYTVAGSLAHYRMGPVETNIGERFYTEIDRKEKKVVVSPRKKEKNKPLPVLDFDKIQEMIQANGVTLSCTKGVQYNKITFSLPEGMPVKSYSMEYAPADHFIRHIKMEMYSGDAANELLVMHIYYRDFSKAPDKTACAEQDYFTVKKGKRIVLNQAFAGYRLVSEP